MIEGEEIKFVRKEGKGSEGDAANFRQRDLLSFFETIGSRAGKGRN